MCNHAGMWNIDCSDLIDDLGIDDFSLSDFIDAINVEYDKITGKKITKERLLVVDESTLWITGFIQFQYQGKDSRVNGEVAVVRSAFMILEGFINPYEQLTNPSQPLVNPQEPLQRIVPPTDNPPTLLDYAIYKRHITLTQPLRNSWTSIKDKDKDKNKDKDSTTHTDSMLSLNNAEKLKKNDTKQFDGDNLQARTIYDSRFKKSS